MIVGWFGYGGSSWYAEMLREEIQENGMVLKTCHEHPNATVPYNHGKINDFIDSCDVIILPQRLKIGQAKGTNRLAIAWSRGKPVIASPLPSYMEFIVPGINALVSDTPEGFIKELLKLKNNPDLMKKLGENGKDTAIKQFNPRDLSNKIFGALSAAKPQNWQIIIPHYSSTSKYLNLAIESALEADGPQREIIVVSSAPESPVLSDKNASHKNVKLIWEKERKTFSEANNIGIRAANPEVTHFLLLNDDTIVSKNAFKVMSEQIKDDMILNPYSNCDMGWLHSDSILINNGEKIKNLFPGMSFEEIVDDGFVSAIKNHVVETKGITNSPFCPMFATLIPKKVLDTVGLLNTSFKNGGEDADYSYRAKRFGIKTCWSKGAFIFHFGGKSRKFSEENNYTQHHEEDNYNNNLLHNMWERGTKKKVAIWTGPAWEKWGPDSYKNGGIGGSELWATRIAEQYAADGCHVMMYGSHDVASVNGVEWRNWESYNPEEEYFDLIIFSRNLNPLDSRIKAKKKVSIIHDIFWLSGKYVSEEKFEMLDQIITLSPWHREFVINHHEIPEKHQHKVIIIPNGMNLEFFE